MIERVVSGLIFPLHPQSTHIPCLPDIKRGDTMQNHILP